jgi:glycosyltransferase involved in cell wall biosynthesis
MNKKVLIIIPCYNEEASISNVIKSLRSLDLPKAYFLDILVINDCSKDNTKEVVKYLGVKMLDLSINLGIGVAVQSGLIYAFNNDFDFAIQLDGDGQHPASEIIKILIHQSQTNANIVIGSRFIEKQGFQSSFARRMGINYFHWINRVITGIKIYDTTSGFRLFDRKAMKVSLRHYPDDYPEPESLILFSRAGLKINEVPIIMAERQGGKSSISSANSLYYCIKVTIAMFFTSIRNYKL